MRCECCNTILTDYEATQRFKGSGEFVDMCTVCVKELPDDIELIGRSDLAADESVDEYDEVEKDD